ncbi:MAG: hypothetical protein K6E84_03910, partial [Lachnospiraceae bacterium]|nr:hypothetical protein [Lachnospiraceae bacterium]
WHDQGIRTMSQIEEEEKKYGNEKKKAKNSKNLSIASRLPQNQYMERKIDYDSQEEEFLKYQ